VYREMNHTGRASVRTKQLSSYPKIWLRTVGQQPQVMGFDAMQQQLINVITHHKR